MVKIKNIKTMKKTNVLMEVGEPLWTTGLRSFTERDLTSNKCHAFIRFIIP